MNNSEVILKHLRTSGVSTRSDLEQLDVDLMRLDSTLEWMIHDGLIETWYTRYTRYYKASLFTQSELDELRERAKGFIQGGWRAWHAFRHGGVGEPEYVVPVNRVDSSKDSWHNTSGAFNKVVKPKGDDSRLVIHVSNVKFKGGEE